MKPTLLIKGSLRAIEVPDTFSGWDQDKSKLDTQKDLDELVAIDYIMDWVKQRLPLIGPENRVLVLQSDTGSGKTTALPPYLFEKFWKKGDGWIAVTQPKRNLATLNAKEIANSGHYKSMILDETIGWQIGNSRRRPKQGVMFMTIGILARHLRTMNDEEFASRYKFIILDEVHEISVHMADVLYLLKQYIARNKDKENLPFIICASATIDIFKYLQYFNVGPLNAIRVSGFAYEKVEHYLPVHCSSILATAVETAYKIHIDNLDDPAAKADIIIFLPGTQETQTVLRELDKLNTKLDGEKKPVFRIMEYSGASVNKNSRDFLELMTPADKLKTYINKNTMRVPIRKIILATSVAEVGVTLSQLKYVIDSGYHRSKEFYPNIPASVLVTKPESQSRVRQRMGRVGRLFPGDWYPLFPKEVYKQLETQQYSDLVLSDFTPILLSILSVHAAGSEGGNESNNNYYDFRTMDLIDSIPASSLQYSIGLCHSLGYLTMKSGDNSTPLLAITPLGQLVNNIIDVPPQYTRMVVAAYSWGVSPLDMITIAVYANKTTKDFTIKGHLPINWQTVYEYALPNIFAKTISGGSDTILGGRADDTSNIIFRIKLLVCDDLIDGLLLFVAIANIMRTKKGKFYPVLSDFCKKAGISLKKITDFIKERDELIESMIELGFKIDLNKSQSIMNIPREEFTNYITGIKYCIYDGLKNNLMTLNTTTGKYMFNGMPVETPAIFSDNLLYRSQKEKLGIDYKSKPKYVLFNSLIMTKKQNQSIYQLTADRISSMDGYVHIDQN